MDPNLIMRRAVLAAAGNPAVSALVRRHGMRLGASRFVAGLRLEDAIAAVRELNNQGMAATLDHLGESVADAGAARAAAGDYLDILDAIAASGVDCNASLKLTQMGLDISRELCEADLRAIVERAQETGNFIRIDMESSAYTDATLDIYRDLRARGFGNVGVVIQAYLRRSEEDLRALAAGGANVRLVKGAYAEPPSLAYPSKRDVDAAMARLVEMYLESGNYTAIATHDPAIIRRAIAFAEARGIGRDRFEFQMLYGIRRDLQRELAAAGHRVRVYVPYGEEWYPYFSRRLAERPANVWFILSNVLRG